MRKVIFMIDTSLDGFIGETDPEVEPVEERDGPMESEEEWEDLNDLLSQVDTVLLGRTTYQLFAEFWPTAATDPERSKNEVDFAHWIEKTPKIVFSKTLETVEWSNTRLIKEQIAEEITNLKQQPGKHLLLFGGPTIAQTFMQLGLIDEYRLRIHPAVSGHGKLLWRDIKDSIPLKLIATRAFSSGTILLSYQSAWE